MEVLKTPWTVGRLSLLGLLLAFGTGGAAPIFSDRLVISGANGDVILDVTRNDSTPNVP